jgi:hypothetical protein
MSVLLMVDLAIGVIVLETLVLAITGHRRSRFPRMRALLPNFAAGLFLLLALHSAARGENLAVTGGCLAIAGIAHAIDLRGRLRAR